MYKDPISITYDALWDLLEGNEDFCEIVKIGNRIKFSGENRAPLKDTQATNDYPEVRIISRTSEAHLIRTSNGSSLKKQFVIQVLTGEQRLTELLYPLEWLIYCIFSKAFSTLKELKYPDEESEEGSTFIRHIALTGGTDQFSVSVDGKPTQRGWFNVLTIDTEMWFATASLIE